MFGLILIIQILIIQWIILFERDVLQYALSFKTSYLSLSSVHLKRIREWVAEELSLKYYANSEQVFFLSRFYLPPPPCYYSPNCTQSLAVPARKRDLPTDVIRNALIHKSPA